MANQYPPTIDPVKETQVITGFIQSTFAKAGKKKVVMAVSGGLDSAVSLMLAVKALAPANVFAYYLPSRTTHPITQEHVRLIIKSAQLPDTNFRQIPLSALIQKAWRIIKHYSEKQPRRDISLTTQENPPKLSSRRPVRVESNASPERQINQLRLANLTARSRMLVLFDQAKKLDALVVGTENLSEHMLGYYTRFGDEASDVEPLRHLYKTQVLELAKYLGVPVVILNKPPTADLWPGQTDAQELGFTYAQADPILYLTSQGKTADEIIQLGFETNMVTQVLQQMKQTSFKHEVPYLLPT